MIALQSIGRGYCAPSTVLESPANVSILESFGSQPLTDNDVRTWEYDYQLDLDFQQFPRWRDGRNARYGTANVGCTCTFGALGIMIEYDDD